jgi:hypothetical protein
MKYFRNDPDFPKVPEGLKFNPGVQNLGPDANEYRGHSGKILDGDNTGVSISTFTAHSSPLGLVFDNKMALSDEFKGDGFVLRNTIGTKSSLMKPFTNQGRDLLHLDMSYDKASDNYFVKTTPTYCIKALIVHTINYYKLALSMLVPIYVPKQIYARMNGSALIALL